MGTLATTTLDNRQMEEYRQSADAKIAGLAAKQEEWTHLGAAAKAALLGEILTTMKAVQSDLPLLADQAVLSMGYESAEGEDATMPWCLEQLIHVQNVTTWCKRFKATLEAVDKTGKCPPAAGMRKRRTLDGEEQVIAEVYPQDGGDKMKPTKGWRCELWMQPGEEGSQGACLDAKPSADSCGLVLGAGNVTALAVIDCLHLLFQWNTVVLYKVHPIRSYHEGFVRKLMAPLIDAGYFEIIQQTELPEAQYLVAHKQLCNIHMTGATETHDAIVWGAKDGRQQRKDAMTPVIDLDRVTVTSELGCVTPYMVCPGDWDDSDVMHHALHLAVSFVGNNGYYCNSPKVLVLADGWPLKEAFLSALKAILENMPPVPPYYPGSHKRYESFEAVYGDQMERIEGPGFGKDTAFGKHIPWTLFNVTVDPTDLNASINEFAFRNEPFCPILSVCHLKGVTTAAQFLQAAPRVANECIWGRLSCSLIVHPSTAEGSAQELEAAIAELEYGAVVLNAWSALAYSFECGVWGGYGGAGGAGKGPLETVDHVESGVGFVNNALGFDHIEKAVYYCPFKDPQTQIGTGDKLSRSQTLNITNFMINPGPVSLVKMLAPGLFRPHVQAVIVVGVAAIAFLVSKLIM